MNLESNVFDVWVFQRNGGEPRFLVLRTSEEKARRYFNGGRFWQIPSNVVRDGERIVDSIRRLVGQFGLTASAIWAGEHAYTIYNRRFETMQIIGVFAAEVSDSTVRLDAAEHSEYAWLPYEACLDRVHFRGLKDGLRSVHEYITAPANPAAELCLFSADH